MDIWGYPRTVFPPTDFHTATLVGGRIVIIGSLGYPADRKVSQTFVATLNLQTFAITQIPTTGTPPGWIHAHSANYVEGENSILIQNGKMYLGKDAPLQDNVDDWELNIRDWQWRRLTQRQWPQRFFSRQDGGLNHYGAIWLALCIRQLDEFDADMQALKNKLGRAPDLALFHALFHPSVPHELLPAQEDELHVVRVMVEGVVVRFMAERTYFHMRVEGSLPEATVEALSADLIRKAAALENHPFVVRSL